MNTILNILAFIALLLVLIGFHEFAHLIVGKLAKIPVERFSIGFGPAIVKWRIGETTYQLSVLPLGGYVKFKGEDFDDPEGFFSFPFGRKTATTAAGIVANLLLAVIVYFFIVIVYGIETPPAVLELPEGSSLTQAGFQAGDRVVTVDGKKVRDFYGFIDFIPNPDTLKVTVVRSDGRHNLLLAPSDRSEVDYLVDAVVARVLLKGPADRAGIKPGDRIIAIDGKPVRYWHELVRAVSAADSGEALEFTWIHKSDTLRAGIVPEMMDTTGSPKVGVVAALPSRALTFKEALWLPLVRTGEVTARILVTVGRLFTGKESVKNLAGPVGIYQLTAQSLSLGFDALLSFLAFLSISLAILNLLPIPLFDGGRILMFTIEKIIGRRLGKMVWTVATYIGVALIAALVILVFYNDISRIITGG
ncbi:MAG: RIP metalloprotease RseP [Candidatus Stahlbacteria bacterium]|nr:MAG: RIP metalloprotease RseP [Candidatus Stahlbacteria bacterium]